MAIDVVQIIFYILSTVVGGTISLITTKAHFKTKREDEFRLVGLDKKLETHQLAFHLWYSSIKQIIGDDDERKKRVNECEEFWSKNCLYLTTPAGNAFKQFYTDLANYKLYSEQNKEAKKNHEEKPYNLTWIYENLIKTGQVIANEIHKPLIMVELPKEIQSKFDEQGEGD